MRRPEEIVELTRANVDRLFRSGCRLVILACNTASAAALEQLKAELPVPVIDVVEPGARALVAATRTGEVGVIAVTGAERFKGGSRITFVCGQRALGAFGAFRDAVTGSVRALSVLPAELPDAIERLQADARRLRQSMRGLQEQLAGHEARRIVSEAAAAGHAGRIVHRLDGWDAAGVKAVALAITGLAPATAVLVGRADPTTVAVATSIAGHDAREGASVAQPSPAWRGPCPS